MRFPQKKDFWGELERTPSLKRSRAAENNKRREWGTTVCERMQKETTLFPTIMEVDREVSLPSVIVGGRLDFVGMCLRGGP